MRRDMRAAAIAAMGLGLIFTAIGEAEAQKARDTRSLDLVRDAASSDPDAVGDLRLKTTRKGETGRLRLRNLEPRTWYEVRDAASGEVVGQVRTNRRGKAKLKIRHRARAAKSRFDVPDELEIRCRDTGESLLRVETDVPAEGTAAHGFGEYQGADGHVAWLDMLSLPDEGLESFYMTLQPPFDPEATTDVWYEVSSETLTGELPLGVATVTELAGRNFRIVGPRGDVLVRGALPDVEPFRRWMPPEMEEPWFGGPPLEEPSRGPGADGARGGDGAGMNGVGMSGVGMSGVGMMRDVADPFEWDVDMGPPADDIRYDDMFPMMPPEWMPFPLPVREPSDLVLQIADDNGDLVDAARFVRWSVERPDWNDDRNDDGWDCPRHGDEPMRDAPNGDVPNRDGPMRDAPVRGDGTDAAGNSDRR